MGGYLGDFHFSYIRIYSFFCERCSSVAPVCVNLKMKKPKHAFFGWSVSICRVRLLEAAATDGEKNMNAKRVHVGTVLYSGLEEI